MGIGELPHPEDLEEEAAADLVWKIIGEVTDSSLTDLLRLTRTIEEIDDVVSDHTFYQGGETCRTRPFVPRLEFAQSAGDGAINVPVADRGTLARYLGSDEVVEAIAERYSLLEEDIVVPSVTAESGIDRLEKRQRTINHSDLLMLAGAYFWSNEKYLSPADTLRGIVADIPDEGLIPLLLLLEEDFPKIVDEDGCYVPIFKPIDTEYFAADGIIWQSFNSDEIRSHLAEACEPTGSAHSNDEYSGFDYDKFDESFFDHINYTGSNSDEDDDFDFAEYFMDEMNRREALKHRRVA